MSSSFFLLSADKRDRIQFFLDSLEPTPPNMSDMSQDSLRSSSLSESLLSDPIDPPLSETGTTLPSEPSQRPQTWDDVPQTYKVGDGGVHLMPRMGITRGWFWEYGFRVRRKEDNPKVIRWLCKACSCAKRPPRNPYTLLASNSENIYRHLAVQHKIFSEDPSQADKYRKRPALHHQSSIDPFTKKRKVDAAFEQDQIARFDKMKFRRLIVNWLVETNLPFTAATSPALQAAFHYANPQVAAQQAMPDPRAVRKQILSDFYKYKSRVTEALARSPGQVHIAFDGWTSLNRHGFLAINAQFLDENFEPRKVLLDLPHVEGNHTGVNMAAHVEEVLQQFGITTTSTQLGYFTVDNASNNDTALAELVALKGLEARDAPKIRIRCFGHILNLVARALLYPKEAQLPEDIDEDDFDSWRRSGPIGRLHNLVFWIHRSQLATDFLRNLQKEAGRTKTLDVVVDNATRWLSQFDMMKRALELQPFIEELVGEASSQFATGRSQSQRQRRPLAGLHVFGKKPACLVGDNILTKDDWSAIQWFCAILEHFEKRLKMLERDNQLRVRRGGRTTRLSGIWEVFSAFDQLLHKLEDAKVEAKCRPAPSYYQGCVHAAWDKLDQYWSKIAESPIYYAATVLHPGFGLQYLTGALQDQPEKGLSRIEAMAAKKRGREWAAEAEKMVRGLWEQQYRDLDPDPRWGVLSPASPDMDHSDLDEEERAIHRKRNLSTIRSGPSTTQAVDELDRWLLSVEGRYLSPKADPIKYWVDRRFEYPRLAKMAFDVLNVPPMAAEYRG
ncbi:hypothetical protein CHGG_02270 [Chaetomium globosum CBS 148.51]|uniref:HAT C-terminal dimerisation domain-containing protein n=1 Tax=Chaetomium globosum (strain ATCC 6205 / CBS 148.51 / DSM 1962 / NBRC 6347 / NRRL 1970) TaxID=306901 RepID=Q2HBY4_CHAGB|nr:uncharacterized protein CHGG_02270 [Chaetomium globosum CBS 148.51]EAQ90335.1 hypothetical protein CHGG_02270 [Chaetomium globosum CBS 148.51]